MFNWFVSIFMVASIAVLFVTWMKAIRVKELIGDALQKEWTMVRILVFVAFVCELILLICSLVALRVTFAYLAAIYLTYFSVVLYYVVTFFISALSSCKGEVCESKAPPSTETPN